MGGYLHDARSLLELLPQPDAVALHQGVHALLRGPNPLAANVHGHAADARHLPWTGVRAAAHTIAGFQHHARKARGTHRHGSLQARAAGAHDHNVHRGGHRAHFEKLLLSQLFVVRGA